ncbi:MAG: VWA domain-containing protein [Verrucomicrobiota bacterium]
MKISTHLDYEVILANRACPVFFAVHFEAPVLGQARSKPIAFCLVLDRSGSMNGQPLTKAKQAALLAVRNLRPEDSFGLVIFDDEAQVIIPFQPAAKKEGFLRIIESIEVGGNTNLTGGWMLGRDELQKATAGVSRRLLLLSDGLLNRGVVEASAVRQVVTAGLQQHDIRTSCLGFGANYNEDLMTTMAQVSGGQFYDADAPERFPAIFESELDGLQKLTAQNLRIRLRRLDFCESQQPLGNYPKVDRPEGWIEYFLGDLVSGETRVACFQLNVLPLPWVDGRPVVSLEGERLLEVEIVYDEIGEAEITSRTVSQVVRIQATQKPEEVRQKVEVIPWVAMQRAGQVMDEATRHLDADRMEEAVQALNQAIASLKSYGPGASVGEAVQQLENLLGRITSGHWSVRERKFSKYRSHSYRKMSSREHWSASEPPPSFKQPPQNPPIPPAGPTTPPAGGSIS